MELDTGWLQSLAGVAMQLMQQTACVAICTTTSSRYTNSLYKSSLNINICYLKSFEAILTTGTARKD